MAKETLIEVKVTTHTLKPLIRSVAGHLRENRGDSVGVMQIVPSHLGRPVFREAHHAHFGFSSSYGFTAVQFHGLDNL